MRRTLSNLFIAAGLLLSVSAFAAGDPDATPMFPWSRISPDPRVMATGGAGYADAEASAWAPFRNAALLPLSAAKSIEAAFSWTGWMPSAEDGVSNHFGGAASFHFGKFAFGAGMRYLPGKEYEMMNDIGIRVGFFTPSDLEADFGVGYAVTEALSVGANFRYLDSSVSDNESYHSFAGDLSVRYSFGALAVAAGLSNLGTPVKDQAGVSFDIPTSLSLGLVGQKVFNEVHSVTGLVDADYYFSGAFTAAVGARYSFAQIVSLRAGYHFGTSDAVVPSFLSFGAGVSYKGIGLDLAYLTDNEDLAGSLVVGLSYRF